MKFFKDYKHKYEVERDGLITTCTARSQVRVGDKVIPVKGYGEAKCHKEDVYNKEFGYELAKIRAKRELCTKIENVFIDQTKKRTWNRATLFKILLNDMVKNLRAIESIYDIRI